jgi:hypothetical protein
MPGILSLNVLASGLMRFCLDSPAQVPSSVPPCYDRAFLASPRPTLLRARETESVWEGLPNPMSQTGHHQGRDGGRLDTA